MKVYTYSWAISFPTCFFKFYLKKHPRYLTEVLEMVDKCMLHSNVPNIVTRSMFLGKKKTYNISTFVTLSGLLTEFALAGRPR